VFPLSVISNRLWKQKNYQAFQSLANHDMKFINMLLHLLRKWVLCNQCKIRENHWHVSKCSFGRYAQAHFYAFRVNNFTEGHKKVMNFCHDWCLWAMSFFQQIQWNLIFIRKRTMCDLKCFWLRVWFSEKFLRIGYIWLSKGVWNFLIS
jgi:hypothetical protein